MTKEEMKAAIVELVTRRRGSVSFAELDQHVEGFHAKKDEPGMALMPKPHIIFWVGMTLTGAEAIVELMDEQKLCMAATNVMVYLLDGQMLRLPIATRKYNYKKDHWLPVTFHLPDEANDKTVNGWLLLVAKRKRRK